jgi:hypothetical protein
MKNWVFFLEEPSAQDFLEGYLERFSLEGVALHFQVFEGKQDLEKQLGRRIKYWRLPNSRFLVMRDQDSGDCISIKEKLRAMCVAADRDEAVIRIACRELESFFVGDWLAIAQAFEKPALASRARTAKFRMPDNLGSPSKELKQALTTYSKRDGARRISRKLDPERNKSTSFQVLHRTLMDWIENA